MYGFLSLKDSWLRRHNAHPEQAEKKAEDQREWLGDLESRVMEQRKRKAELNKKAGGT